MVNSLLWWCMNGYNVCRLLRWCSGGVEVGVLFLLVILVVVLYVDMVMGGVV